MSSMWPNAEPILPVPVLPRVPTAKRYGDHFVMKCFNISIIVAFTHHSYTRVFILVKAANTTAIDQETNHQKANSNSNTKANEKAELGAYVRIILS